MPGFIELMHGLGVDGVDLGYYWRGDEERRRARAKLEECGLTLACYITSNDFALPDAGRRREELEKVKKAVAEAKDMGAPLLRVFAGNLGEGIDARQAEEWAVEMLSEAADHARDEGIVLALENHGRYFSRIDVVERVLSSVSSSHLRLNFDTGNFVWAGDDPLEALRRLGGYVVHVHAKDVDAKGGACSPGEGLIDFPAIVRGLQSAGFSGFYSIEYEGSRDQLLGVGLGVGYLRALGLKMSRAL